MDRANENVEPNQLDRETTPDLELSSGVPYSPYSNPLGHRPKTRTPGAQSFERRMSGLMSPSELLGGKIATFPGTDLWECKVVVGTPLMLPSRKESCLPGITAGIQCIP